MLKSLLLSSTVVVVDFNLIHMFTLSPLLSVGFRRRSLHWIFPSPPCRTISFTNGFCHCLLRCSSSAFLLLFLKIPKRVHPNGHAYVIPMDFLKWQHMVIALIAFMPAIAPGEIQVGLGPCGELRYPSYPETDGTWKFPGIGEFQCYDKYMRSSLEASAAAIGKKEWGLSGPHDSGQYNQYPEDTGFFKREGTWNTEYGDFFLDWYSSKLVEHGEKIIVSAKSIFQTSGVKLSAKIAGIHWHYNARSHATELTTGYYNTRFHDGYIPIAQMLAKHGVILNFTCMEMKDNEQPCDANWSPEGLVNQVRIATKNAGDELAGENALERYDFVKQ